MAISQFRQWQPVDGGRDGEEKSIITEVADPKIAKIAAETQAAQAPLESPVESEE